MSPSQRYAKKQAKARQRRRLQAHERLARDRRQAQRAAEALHQALDGGLGPASTPGGGDRRPLTQPTHAPGQDGGDDVSVPLWRSDPLGSMSRAGLGPPLARSDAGGLSQTLLAQAAPVLGAGSVGTTLAPCSAQEPGDPESLAVDLGLG
jgi:hypothetical protein